jgi:hypothetical protein
MEQQHNQNQLDNLIIKLVPNEYIFAKDDDSHRIMTIFNIVNNKIPHLSENSLIKAVVFHILRETDFKVDTLVPFFLIGLRNASSSDLNSTTTPAYSQQLAKRLLEESTEEDGMDCVNRVLSTINDKLPIDLKERMMPATKEAIVKYLMLVYKGIREPFDNSNVMKRFYARAAIQKQMLNSGIAGYSAQKKTDQTNQNQEEEDQQNDDSNNSNDSNTSNDSNNSNWTYNMKATSESPLNTCNNRPILAQYVDAETPLYVSRNDKVYLYDTTSNALHYMPNNLNDISISQLETLLKQYKISPAQIQNIISNMTSATSAPLQPSGATLPASQIPSSTPTTSASDTTQLINVIKSYQSEYIITNYIVLSFLAFIVSSIIFYVIYKVIIMIMGKNTKE